MAVPTVSMKFPEQVGLCRILCGGWGGGVACEPEGAKVAEAEAEVEGESDFGAKSLSDSVLPALPWTTSCWFASSRLPVV